jgi:hypothetical protein
MFANTSTKTLIGMNTTYLKEYREDPTDAKRRAVEESSRELSRRGWTFYISQEVVT